MKTRNKLLLGLMSIAFVGGLAAFSSLNKVDAKPAKAGAVEGNIGFEIDSELNTSLLSYEPNACFGILFANEFDEQEWADSFFQIDPVVTRRMISYSIDIHPDCIYVVRFDYETFNPVDWTKDYELQSGDIKFNSFSL